LGEDLSVMLYHERSEDYRPLFWLGGRPFYVNTVIFAFHILAFAVTALAVSFYGAEVLGFLALGNYEAVHGEIWRLFSYIIFPPQTAITFIFAMGFLFYFGRAVEEHVGRKTYIKLFAALIFIPSILFCLLGFTGLWRENYLGGYGSIFGVFIAFATLYPGVEINIWFVNLTAKGWAYALLAVLTLFNLAFHQWLDLGALWCDAAVGYLGMRLIGAGYGMTWLTDWIEDRQAARLARQRNIKVLKDVKASESIDEILEKISKHGVGSLDATERAALERARTNLLKRDQR
jgi:membrane associated rhomboid family serine protease